MRDNHDGLLEILDAFEKAGQYFQVICSFRLNADRAPQLKAALDGYRFFVRITA